MPISFVEPEPSVGLTRTVRSGIDALLGRSFDARREGIDWAAVWRQLEHHRSAGLLVHLSGQMDPDVASRVRSYAHSSVLLQLSLADAGRRAVAGLSEAGIESRVLKGLATSLLDYPKGAIRHTGDVDLLVRPRDFARASAILRAMAVDDLKADQPVDLLVEATFRTESGFELDLHHRLFRVAAAHDDLLFARPEPLPDGLGNALSLEGRLLHAAGHLMLAPPGHRRLSSLVDVALLDANPALDEDALAELTDAFGLDDLVRFARWLANAIGNERASDPPTWRKTALNRAHLRADRSIFWETAAVLQQQNSAAERARYLAYQMKRLLPDRFTATAG